MGEVRLDAAEVRAVAQSVVESAETLGEIRWPAAASAELPGSAVERAVAAAGWDARVADLVTGLLAWAAAAQSAAAGVEEAGARHAERLGSGR